MRLADFILANVEPILVEWEAFARGMAPGAKMTSMSLRDHAEAILVGTARDMQSSQTETEQTAKSRGLRRAETDLSSLNEASEIHAVDRLGAGFALLELVSEYRALRSSVLRLWRDSRPSPHDYDVDELTRFNESIDQSVAHAVKSYTNRVDQSRDLFLAILSHDLRNPLNSIAMSASMMRLVGEPLPEAAKYISQIATNTRQMGG